MSNPTNPNVPANPADPLHGTVVGPQDGPPPAARNGVVAPPAPAGSPKQFPTMAELLQGFRRCWPRAVTVSILGAAVMAVALWFGVPRPRARARTLLRVSPETPYVVFPTPESRIDFAGYKKTQSTLVKSRLVLNAALRQPKVADLPLVKQQSDPVEWLEQKLVVDFTAGPEILTIALDGNDPEGQTAIVNAVTRAYFDEVVTKDEGRHLERLDKLEKIRSKYDEKLESKRRLLREIGEAAGSRDPANLALKQRIALEQLAAAQKDLTMAKTEVRQLHVQEELNAEREKAGAGITVPEVMVNDQVEKDLLVHTYSERLTQLQQQTDEIRRVNPTRFAQVRAYQDAQIDIESVKKSLDDRRAKIRPVIERQLREQLRVQSKAELTREKDRLAYLTRLEKSLGDDVERLDKEARSLNKSGLDLESLREEVAQAEDILKKVATQAEALNVERDADPRIRILEEGVASRPDQRLRQMGASVGGGFGALLFLLFGFSWWEWRSLRINSPEEVIRSLGLKVMGTLPHIPSQSKAGRGTRAAGALPWQNLLLESVDSMRTMLLHAARTDSVHVLMITSAMGGEGKTSLSCHLATSLARAGRKTLLIDGDLRKPSLRQVFDLPERPGFCELLRGEGGAAEAVLPSGVNGLSVLQAGECDEASLAALAQGKAGTVFAELRGQYDFLVVDSAPLLPVTDSLLLAQDTDAVLLSILRDVSRLGRVEAANERLALLGVRTLGAVVTGIPQGELYGHYSHYIGMEGRGKKAEAAAVEEKP